MSQQSDNESTTTSNASSVSVRSQSKSRSRNQGIFWILTIPYLEWKPPSELPVGLSWLRGQHERGDNGYEHWQVLVAFGKKVALKRVKEVFGSKCHAELSRSPAANEYVWKEESRVGVQFEFGAKPIRRNSRIDWESVWVSAKRGELDAIPGNVRVVSYRTLRAIAADHDKPAAYLRECYVFWGATGTGKSRRAWEEAGLDAYAKDPRTKFWCGYQGERNVILDEFRGGIDIAHLLRWLDRYPVRVEIKGSSKPLVGGRIWITSNLDPRLWYPEADEETVKALMRRLTITHFN